MIQPNDPRITMFKIKALQMGQSPEAIDAFVAQQLQVANQKEQKTGIDLQQEQIALQKAQIDLANKQRTPEELAQVEVNTAVAKEKALKKEGLDKASVDAKKAESEAEAKKKAKNKGYASAAQNLLNVLDAGEKGKLKGKAYEDALNFAASKMAESTFETGGKQLTEMEQALLQGSRPTIQIKNANIVQRALGIVPPQTAKVLDDSGTLRRKALAAISMASGEEITPELLASLQAVEGEQSQKSGVKGFVQNVGADTKGVLNGILNLPRASIDNYNQVQAQNPNRIPSQMQLMLPVLKNAATGYVKNLNEDLGRPLEGGDIIGRAGQNFYNRPVSTVLDILPIAGGLKKLSGTSKVTNTVKGADAIAVGAKNAPKVAPIPGEGNAIQRYGTAMRANVAKPKVPASAYYAKNVDDLMTAQKELGLTGNAESQLSQLPAKMEKLTGDIKVQIKGKKIDPSITNSSVQKYMDDIDYLGEESRAVNEINKINKRIAKTNGSAEAIYQLKNDLSNEMSSVFKKLEKGEDLTPQQAVKYAAWKGLKDSIDTVSTEVRRINTLQHRADELSRGLVLNADKGGLQIPFVGKVGGKSIQSGRDILGRVLQQASW